MDGSAIYIKYGQISAEVKSYYKRTGTCISFLNAVNKIYASGNYDREPSPTPDFLSWDVTNPEQLRELFSTVSICINPFINPKKDTVYIDTILPSSRDILTLIHTNYEAVSIQEHDFFEINYVISGSCQLRFDSETRILDQGEFCLIAPHAPHNVKTIGDSIVLCIDIKESTFESTFFDALLDDNPLALFFKNILYNSKINYLLFMTEPTEYICTLFKHIFMESLSEKKYANKICINYIEILFSEILRNYSNTYMYYDLHSGNASSKIVAILEYIKYNYSHITFDELTTFSGYDKAYLGKLIKNSTGLFYNDIINNYKVEKAKLYLETTHYSIAKISELVGFGSPTYFSQCFKKSIGCSPNHYRKTYKS